MAIIKCAECKNKVSDKAKACPNCGARPKKRSSCLGIILLLFFGAVLINVTSTKNQNTYIANPAPIKNTCPKIISHGSKYISNPNWLSRNNRCFDVDQRQKLIVELYTAVKKVPSSQVKKNRDGYKGLTILDSLNKIYKKKLAHYSKKLIAIEKQNKEQINITSTTKQNAVDNAYKLCFLLDNTGLLSKPCDISAGWNPAISISIDTSSSKARKMCSNLVDIAKQKNLQFDRKWKLKIYSPFSSKNTIAYCKLPN
jgi:uncharacterized protein YwgA